MADPIVEALLNKPRVPGPIGPDGREVMFPPGQEVPSSAIPMMNDIQPYPVNIPAAVEGLLMSSGVTGGAPGAVTGAAGRAYEAAAASPAVKQIATALGLGGAGAAVLTPTEAGEGAAPKPGMSPREVRNAEIRNLELQIEAQQRALTQELNKIGAQKFRGVGEEAGMARQAAMAAAATPFNDNINAIRERMAQLRGANDDEDKRMVGVESRADSARREVLAEGNQPFNKTAPGQLYNQAGPAAPAIAGAATTFAERALHGPKAGWKLPIGLGIGAGAFAANAPLGWDAFFTPSVNPEKSAFQTYGQELKIGQHPRAQEWLDYAASLPEKNPTRENAKEEFWDPKNYGLGLGKRMAFGAGEGAIGAATGLAGAVGLERLGGAARDAVKWLWNHRPGSQSGGPTGPSPGGPSGGGGGRLALPGTVVEDLIPLEVIPQSKMLPSPNQEASRLVDKMSAGREAAGQPPPTSGFSSRVVEALHAPANVNEVPKPKKGVDSRGREFHKDPENGRFTDKPE